MEIKITRHWRSDKSIIGILRVHEGQNKIYECFTLENPHIGKTPNKDYAIPYGTYTMDWRMSPKYSKAYGHEVPWLYNEMVPKERYILIHSGNTEVDTLGCILLGKGKSKDFVSASKKAIEEFYGLCKARKFPKIDNFQIVEEILSDERTSNRDEK